MEIAQEIYFKDLNDPLLPLIFGWINQPHIIENYTGEYCNYEDVVNSYCQETLKEYEIAGHIIYCDHHPIGYIQNYLLEEDYYGHGIVCENAAGLDVFIGESNFVYKGLGSKIITKFLKEIVLIEDISNCIINPKVDNKRAIKAYEKIGFKHLKTIDDFYVMQIFKNQL